MSLPGVFVAKEQVMVCAFRDVRAVRAVWCCCLFDSKEMSV